MMALEWTSLLPELRSVVIQTGDYILEQAGKVQAVQIEDKAVNSLVSYVDRTAEEMLVGRLALALPGSTFLTEEETIANEDSDLQWIIDPLDGTTNFLHGIPDYVVSVALRAGGELVLGMVYEPNRKECFHAIRGGGAFLNDKPVSVSGTARVSDALLATGFPYYDYDQTAAYLRVLEYFMRHSRGIRRIGAAALDLAYTACGRFDGFFEYSLNPWDVAAGILLVREAGGRVADFQRGDNALFGKEIIASAPALFDPIHQVIAAEFHGPSR